MAAAAGARSSSEQMPLGRYSLAHEAVDLSLEEIV